MRLFPSILTAAITLTSASFDAKASLESQTINGINVVHSSVSNVTWLQDANLLATLIDSQGFDVMVNAIVTASPTITNTPNVYDGNDGIYELSSNDFQSDGSLTWFGARAFVHYLNHIQYGGSDQWRLPDASGLSGTDGAMALLYYQELGGQGAQPIPNTDYFLNEEVAPAYWLAQEDLSVFGSAGNAKSFIGYYGDERDLQKNRYEHVWAISPGKISAVPLPASGWLLGVGLVGIWRKKLLLVSS